MKMGTNYVPPLKKQRSVSVMYTYIPTTVYINIMLKKSLFNGDYSLKSV